MFEQIQPGPVDPMFDLKKLADNDTSPEKIDLGVGIYRSEQGRYHEIKAVHEASVLCIEICLGLLLNDLRN